MFDVCVKNYENYEKHLTRFYVNSDDKTLLIVKFSLGKIKVESACTCVQHTCQEVTVNCSVVSEQLQRFDSTRTRGWL